MLSIVESIPERPRRRAGGRGLSQIGSRAAEKSNYVQSLIQMIHHATDDPAERDPNKSAIPYYVVPPSNGEKGRVAKFPDEPGVYAIVRYFRFRGRMRPRVLYVGIAHQSTIRLRLATHFRRKNNPEDYNGSRFANAMWEIVQSDEDVFRLLKSSDTRIAAIGIPDRSKGYLEDLERLCIQVLNPLLNIHG